jgi:hypothetical protein
MCSLVFEPEVVTPYILGRREYMLLNLYGCLKSNHMLVLLLSWCTKIGRKRLSLLLVYPNDRIYD